MNQLCIDTLRQFALEGRLGARAPVGGCAYRHEQRRCAIGALLEGFTIHADENTLGIEELCGQRADIESHLLTTFHMTVDEARELQKQHDGLALTGALPDNFLTWIDGLEQQLNLA